jgi:hypothetical protein
MNSIEKTINDLSADLKPVKVIESANKRLAKWLLVGFCYVIFLCFFFGLRFDIEEKIIQPVFLAELIIVLLGTVLAALSAFYLSVPDSYQKPFIKWLGTLPFLALTLVIIYQYFEQQVANSKPINSTLNTYQCFADMLLFALFPIAVMLFYMKKGATTNYDFSGFMLGLSAVSFSYLTLRLIEPNDVISHIILWHYVPMMVAIIVAVFVGRIFLKW